MAQKSKTRISYDSTGRAIREVQNEQGEFEPDDGQDKTYTFNGDLLSLEDSRKGPKPEFNPYQGSQVGSPTKKRSRLDYMRELSEAIKKSRAGGDPPKK